MSKFIAGLRADALKLAAAVAFVLSSVGGTAAVVARLNGDGSASFDAKLLEASATVVIGALAAFCARHKINLSADAKTLTADEPRLQAVEPRLQAVEETVANLDPKVTEAVEAGLSRVAEPNADVLRPIVLQVLAGLSQNQTVAESTPPAAPAA